MEVWWLSLYCIFMLAALWLFATIGIAALRVRGVGFLAAYVVVVLLLVWPKFQDKAMLLASEQVVMEDEVRLSPVYALKVSIVKLSEDGNLRIAARSSSKLMSLPFEYESVVSEVVPTKNGYEYRAFGVLRWKLFSIAVYNQKVAFKGYLSR